MGLDIVALVWGLPVVSTVLKVCGGIRYTICSTGVYLAMDWLILIAA